jgi:hypothetical protein
MFFFSKKQRVHFFLDEKTNQKNQWQKMLPPLSPKIFILLLSGFNFWFTAFPHPRLLPGLAHNSDPWF